MTLYSIIAFLVFIIAKCDHSFGKALIWALAWPGIVVLLVTRELDETCQCADCHEEGEVMR